MALTQDQDQRLSLWMQSAQSGDKRAYESLLIEASQLLRLYFISRCDSEEGAEDLVQETLISIHKYRHTYMSGRPYAPWMYAIAKRRLVDYWRLKSRKIMTTELDMSTDISVAWESSNLSVDVSGALARLPEAQRKVVEFLKLKGLSLKETAKEMDMSVAAVKITAHRAYGRLRKELSGEKYEHTNKN